LDLKAPVIPDLCDLIVATADRLQIARVVWEIAQHRFATQTGACIADQIVGDALDFRIDQQAQEPRIKLRMRNPAHGDKTDHAYRRDRQQPRSHRAADQGLNRAQYPRGLCRHCCSAGSMSR
jgi:hypothetical protein